MSVLEFGAIVQYNWEQNCQAAFHPYEVCSTWASDLAVAMWFEKQEPGAIERTIKDGIKNWKTDKEMLIQLGMAVNFLSWYCYSDNRWSDYVNVFSDWYYWYIDEMDKIDTDIYAKIHFYLD